MISTSYSCSDESTLNLSRTIGGASSRASARSQGREMRQRLAAQDFDCNAR
jgi:hypothetical protein